MNILLINIAQIFVLYFIGALIVLFISLILDRVEIKYGYFTYRSLLESIIVSFVPLIQILMLIGAIVISYQKLKSFEFKKFVKKLVNTKIK